MASEDTSGEKKANKQGESCVACRFHHRRCLPDCVLRPYFRSNNGGQELKSVNDFFGVGNIRNFFFFFFFRCRLSSRRRRRSTNPIPPRSNRFIRRRLRRNNNFPGSIAAAGGTNGSFSVEGYFSNFTNEDETMPLKKNQAQAQQQLVRNNKNAIGFLPDNAGEIQSMISSLTDERVYTMWKDDGNPFL
ncbi:unnamed protein product [Cochlearia groenlandica]